MANLFQKTVVDNVDHDTLKDWHNRVVTIQDQVAQLLKEVGEIEDNPTRILLTNKFDEIGMYANDTAEDLEDILGEYPLDNKE